MQEGGGTCLPPSDVRSSHVRTEERDRAAAAGAAAVELRDVSVRGVQGLPQNTWPGAAPRLSSVDCSGYKGRRKWLKTLIPPRMVMVETKIHRRSPPLLSIFVDVDSKTSCNWP